MSRKGFIYTVSYTKFAEITVYPWLDYVIEWFNGIYLDCNFSKI